MAGVLEKDVETDEKDEKKEVADEDVGKKPFFKRPLVLFVMAVLLVIGLIFGIRYYIYAKTHTSTDDAFVDGDVIQISPKVSGHVMKLYVTDNQRVKKGDLLVELDPRDFQTRLDQAKANLQEAESKQNAARSNVE